MHQVTFLISALPPGCIFQLWLHFSHLWNICQKNAPRIFDTSCINKFWWNLVSCIARILKRVVSNKQNYFLRSAWFSPFFVKSRLQTDRLQQTGSGAFIRAHSARCTGGLKNQITDIDPYADQCRLIGIDAHRSAKISINLHFGSMSLIGLCRYYGNLRRYNFFSIFNFFSILFPLFYFFFQRSTFLSLSTISFPKRKRLLFECSGLQYDIFFLPICWFFTADIFKCYGHQTNCF